MRYVLKILVIHRSVLTTFVLNKEIFGVMFFHLQNIILKYKAVNVSSSQISQPTFRSAENKGRG